MEECTVYAELMLYIRDIACLLSWHQQLQLLTSTASLSARVDAQLIQWQDDFDTRKRQRSAWSFIKWCSHEADFLPQVKTCCHLRVPRTMPPIFVSRSKSLRRQDAAAFSPDSSADCIKPFSSFGGGGNWRRRRQTPTAHAPPVFRSDAIYRQQCGRSE